jgi:hypothetical protein
MSHGRRSVQLALRRAATLTAALAAGLTFINTPARRPR